MNNSPIIPKDQWKEEVIEFLIVDGIYRKEHETNPRKALLDLIKWETDVALDPRVSNEARDLTMKNNALLFKLMYALAYNNPDHAQALSDNNFTPDEKNEMERLIKLCDEYDHLVSLYQDTSGGLPDINKFIEENL